MNLPALLLWIYVLTGDAEILTPSFCVHSCIFLYGSFYSDVCDFTSCASKKQVLIESSFKSNTWIHVHSSGDYGNRPSVACSLFFFSVQIQRKRELMVAKKQKTSYDSVNRVNFEFHQLWWFVFTKTWTSSYLLLLNLLLLKMHFFSILT